MEITKQISVFLENKPGRLAQVLSALASERVNLRALAVMEKQERGVLRLVADDPAGAARVLKKLGTSYTEVEVLLVELKNHPGSLARVCERLGAEHLNIDYAYCSAGSPNGKTLGVLKVPNLKKAMRVLEENFNGAARRRPEQRPLRDRHSYQLVR